MIIPNTTPIEPTNIFAGCVAEFENIWPDFEQTIQKIEKELSAQDSPLATYWNKAQTFSGKDNIRTNTLFPVHYLASIDATSNELNNRFFESAYAATTWYKKHFNIEEDIYESKKEGLVLLRYQMGEEYKLHYDGPTASGRCVSPILYLNEDYEGGVLEFPYHALKIKPKAGTLYLFPANYAYAHIAHPVTEGTKYALVTWFHDRDND